MDHGQVESPAEDLKRIVASARDLGVEMDEQDALQWLTNMAAVKAGAGVVVDERAGVYGHQVTLYDFSPKDLAHFRRIGRLVEFDDEPGVVETALALSGSAAQSKIQTYPGDCDYFERVNIKAPTRDEACRVLARIMRDKALSTLRGPTYQFIELKFGSYPCDVVRGDRTGRAGAPIAWSAADVESGRIEGFSPGGAPVTILWEDVMLQPGWCKLDWVIADPQRGQLSNASNMLDVTWEAPDGAVTPLDGYLDPYFQEVYLDAASVPIFSKLSKHVAANALDDYVSQLHKEIVKYLTKDLNYGKAAKRMYNVFRLTGRYRDAAFLRELFDEPATALYQTWSLVRTLDDTLQSGSAIPTTNLVAQADQLILSVVKALEGVEEETIVRQLLRLREHLARHEGGKVFTDEAEAARAELMNIVNNFFYERLIAVPAIRDYIEDIQKQNAHHSA